jgi:two-component system, chemotaxis family, protein-glutamate methylesterase/glutaminase
MDALNQPTMRQGPGFDLVAIAASWGGPPALATLLAGLPGDFPAAIAVVQHRSGQYPSSLARTLGRQTALTVVDADAGMAPRPGTVYLAPPDRHLLIEPDGTLALSYAERHQFARPAADLLFASTAASYQERAIGVVLTGKQQDGAAGAWAIKARGGRVLAQEPDTCEAPEMPAATIRSGCVDFVLPLKQIADVLITLVMVPGAALLFRVPVDASLARARRLWTA